MSGWTTPMRNLITEQGGLLPQDEMESERASERVEWMEKIVLLLLLLLLISSPSLRVVMMTRRRRGRGRDSLRVLSFLLSLSLSLRLLFHYMSAGTLSSTSAVPSWKWDP